jgi:release factor glutamine methyltransferase
MAAPDFDRVDQALAWARAVLARACDSEPSDARVLLMHVLDVSHAALIAHPERALAPARAAAYRALVERRAAGEPVAYLTGTRAFYGRAFAVTPSVLIPRPETEHLVDAALAWAHGRHGLRIVDVGTGSGIIAVTLAAHLPGAQVWAVDVSAEALHTAQNNARRHGVFERIAFKAGDLLEPLAAARQRADLIAANLPYIPSDELDGLAVVRHEPRGALDGGPDGLASIRRLLSQAPGVLASPGLLLLEIAADQGAPVKALAQGAFPGAQIAILPDYAGHDRIVKTEIG